MWSTWASTLLKTKRHKKRSFTTSFPLTLLSLIKLTILCCLLVSFITRQVVNVWHTSTFFASSTMRSCSMQKRGFLSIKQLTSRTKFRFSLHLRSSLVSISTTLCLPTSIACPCATSWLSWTWHKMHLKRSLTFLRSASFTSFRRAFKTTTVFVRTKNPLCFSWLRTHETAQFDYLATRQNLGKCMTSLWKRVNTCTTLYWCKARYSWTRTSSCTTLKRQSFCKNKRSLVCACASFCSMLSKNLGFKSPISAASGLTETTT